MEADEADKKHQHELAVLQLEWEKIKIESNAARGGHSIPRDGNVSRAQVMEEGKETPLKVLEAVQPLEVCKKRMKS